MIFVPNLAAQTEKNEILEGVWVGTLIIPNRAELRMGITISKDADGTLSAALRIIDQNTGDIPCDEVIYDKDNILLKINHLGIEIEGKTDFENDTIESEYRQRGGKFPLPLKRVDKMPVLNRPQEPKKPFPYNEEDVEYENKKAGIKLAGTLTFPNSGSSLPAVILITGSGQQKRNQEISGHKPFLVLADYLTRQGIAVLRVDDRGIGGSTGNFKQSTSGDFADDVLAGIEYLKGRKEIDSKKMGLIGHSEGGLIAQITADRSSDVAFIVSMAGPGIGFDEMVIFQVLEQLRLEGTSEEDIELQRSWRRSLYSLFKQNSDSTTIANKMKALHSELSENEIKRLNWPKGRLDYEIKRSLSPWWHFALSYDPSVTLKRLECPVLAINGDKDKQVPSNKNLPAIEKALHDGGNQNFLVKELPGLNHLLQTAETGSEYEYGRIEETISPDALSLIASWILDQVK
ncbi:MAG: alpha/beta hydrolase [Candidatus Latescibacteria bacterium]|nr:alpha/beta hydrolase [Candidatus Latescibacterota bacterium]